MPASRMTLARALCLTATLALSALTACSDRDPIGTEEPPAEPCPGVPCGADCCARDQRCATGECVAMDAPCATTEDCAEGQICLAREQTCVEREELGECRYVPPTGEFDPVVECRWRPHADDPYGRFSNVVMAPMVANLTDDDGDGRTGPGDVPDVVFVGFDMTTHGCCNNQGVLRVVSGGCEGGSLPELATIAVDPESGERLHFDNSAGVALGDLDPRGDPSEAVPEIVAILTSGSSGETIALRRVSDDGRQWRVMWRNRSTPSFDHYKGGQPMHGGPQPAIADVDGDGNPEVVVGNVVLDGRTGAVLWDGLETVGPDAGVGNNGFLGPISVVADVDLDGRNELVAGDTIYDAETGALRATLDWGPMEGSCPGVGIRCDGFVAVGDFDGHPAAEIVSVRRGEVGLFGAHGVRRARVVLPGGRTENEGGPPTVADFDGDGRLEIGVASATHYSVVDFDCEGSPAPAGCEGDSIRWARRVDDRSSRATGSSVFDFEGDGRAEVVYADERSFYIFDGETGATLFRDERHRSNTRLELPVVVDVDADGQAEVLVARAAGGGAMVGIDVFGDADRNWVRTRRIWNQHAYFIGNVREFGTVPTFPVQSFTDPARNSFRQNVYAGDPHDAPDLVVSRLKAERCGEGERVRVDFLVENLGAAWVGAGVTVRVQVSPAVGRPFDLAPIVIGEPLDPGDGVRLTREFEASAVGPNGFDVTVTADWVPGSERGRTNECDEENNVASAPGIDLCVGPG